jgi:hypothetical protein
MGLFLIMLTFLFNIIEQKRVSGIGIASATAPLIDAGGEQRRHRAVRFGHLENRSVL